MKTTPQLIIDSVPVRFPEKPTLYNLNVNVFVIDVVGVWLKSWGSNEPFKVHGFFA